MVLSNNYDNSTCMFTSYLLEQTSFNLTFEYSNFQQYNNTPYQYFVIDNTPYKQTLTNGTMKNIYLNIKYTAYIQPSTYYFTIILLRKKKENI